MNLIKRAPTLLLLSLLLSLALSSCTQADPVFTDVDFSNSPYKHVNNGGVTEDDILPYNIDAITGATLTVEGPAVVSSIPLSIRELEHHDAGIFRGVYQDSDGKRIYEGIDLYYMLNEMAEGDNGIILTDSAYRVLLKNSNRATISTFTLAEITQAHEDGKPILLAYGVGTLDEKQIAPFVFDSVNEGEHSLGYNETLNNEDGCLKLVYDQDAYGDNDYTTFSNVAYIYVCEASEPGFKHTGADEQTYGSSRYTDYIIAFRGAQLGREIDLTVEALEQLVVYDENGAVAAGGIGYSDSYSLANNSYWYVNEYEGLDLYKLLLYLGMEDAETMGAVLARTTLVSFVATDGMPSNEMFSVDTLSYPDAFGFYNKNASDLGDGSYIPTNADLVKTGYPVLLAYGVNHYPYTISRTDDAYLSGLANGGGPFRVVFGKTQYNHANGSNQVQLLSELIVGEDILYNTHQFTDNADHRALANTAVAVTVHNESGQEILNRTMSIGEIESIIYGENVAGNVKKAAQVKDSYEVNTGGGYQTDIYEGVDLQYLLMNVVGLPGTNGTITFSNGSETLSLPLEELFRSGYNAEQNRSNLPAIVAFAKNGSPLVANRGDAGYVDEVALHPYLDSDPSVYTVDNWGGPLAVILPSTSAERSDGRYLENVTSITVDLIPDAYAHINAPYHSALQNTVRFYGDGLEQEHTYTVEELESKQTRTHTLDFSVVSESGTQTQERYRGLSVYDLFAEIGIKNNAGDVTVYAADGSSATFSLSLLKKSYPNFAAPDKPEVSAILAYGTGLVDGAIMEGTPLVASDASDGYSAAAKNDGGPLKLVVPQESSDSINAVLFIDHVTAIEVSANEVDTWSHAMSDVYEEFLDDVFTLQIQNDAGVWSYDFTTEQLESLTDLVVRDTYSVLDVGVCEGIDIWKFIQKIAGGVPGIDDPLSITAYASDGYKNDLLSVFYREGFEQGVADENGNRRTLILCYAINGYPLVDSESHAGYTGLAGNGAGPIRVIAESNQGASVKYCNKLSVTLTGSDPIDITIDPSMLEG